MAKIKNKEDLIDKLQEAVANYCYDNKDKNFDVTVSLSAEDGWAKAEIIEED